MVAGEVLLWMGVVVVAQNQILLKVVVGVELMNLEMVVVVGVHLLVVHYLWQVEGEACLKIK
jgi:hypothetical protein